MLRWVLIWNEQPNLWKSTRKHVTHTDHNNHHANTTIFPCKLIIKSLHTLRLQYLAWKYLYSNSFFGALTIEIILQVLRRQTTWLSIGYCTTPTNKVPRNLACRSVLMLYNTNNRAMRTNNTVTIKTTRNTFVWKLTNIAAASNNK